MNRLILAFVLLLFARTAGAQSPEDRLRQFQDLFQEMERRLHAMPKSGLPFGFEADTSFQLRFDTTFTFPDGGGGLHFFFSRPFGEMPNIDFFEGDDFFKQFFQPNPAPDFPADDGAGPLDLLPEERLRLEEEQGAQVKPTKPKPARSTIRL
ncbi:MAG: hypothetical protein ACR2K1_00850 [Saprospiraceae bacterium]